jgi:hypothetical protein
VSFVVCTLAVKKIRAGFDMSDRTIPLLVILESESRGTHDHILLSQIRDSTSLQGQVSAFVSPRNRVARLYPQELGFLFAASYDSQGYGGSNETHLHIGIHSTN